MIKRLTKVVAVLACTVLSTAAALPDSRGCTHCPVKDPTVITAPTGTGREMYVYNVDIRIPGQCFLDSLGTCYPETNCQVVFDVWVHVPAGEAVVDSYDNCLTGAAGTLWAYNYQAPCNSLLTIAYYFYSGMCTDLGDFQEEAALQVGCQACE